MRLLPMATVALNNNALINGYTFGGHDQRKVQEVLDFDCGFTVGILRTSPKGLLSTGYEEVKQNADGFGNSQWVRTISENVVTCDSVTHDGAVYDYTIEPGLGTPLDQLMSLKLWCGKQNLKTDNIYYRITKIERLWSTEAA